MRFFLLGKGITLKSVGNFLKHKKCKVDYFVLTDDFSSFDATLYDYGIKSPSISITDKIFIDLAGKIKFISDLDLLTIFEIPCKCIAITGSNGKTTCVDMLGHYFKNKGIKAIVCGNSHLPIFSYYKKFRKIDFLIIECSSYQLSTLHFFHPFIACIINLSPNHLDHCYSLKQYYQDKLNLIKYQNKFEYCLINPLIKELRNVSEISGNKIELLSCIEDKNILSEIRKYQTQINVLYTITNLLNIQKDFTSIINKFKLLSFREQIYYIFNTKIINDSKSTSIDATLFALSHIKNKENCILLLGGRDKGLSYQRLNEFKDIVFIVYGENRKKIKNQISNALIVPTLKEAIQVACQLEIKNKTILFSPASSSQDQFENFKKRGKYFDKQIKKNKKYL